MKKLFLTVLITLLGINAVMPTKANAAVVIAVAADVGMGGVGYNLQLGALTGGIIGTAAGLMVRAKSGSTKAGLMVFGAFLVLDADASLDKQSMEKVFSQFYPFINNPMVVRDLVSTVKSKIPQPAIGGEQYLVSLSEDETRVVLESADLSPEDIQKIINDLQ